ncbi:MAG: HAD hydrolase family protein [Opitutaceae bacterium]|nr:HAD hydrolase family protein [Opitutaceae bacterium]
MKSPIEQSVWANIKLFAMDVDGILTDGTIRISSDGKESKVFSILDGLGLVRLKQEGIQTAWISGRASEVTTFRAKELKIPHLIQGRIDKLQALGELASDLNLSQHEICYMGDDDIDIDAIRWAAVGITVPDAMPATLEAADYVTIRAAGKGAVREICEHLLKHRATNP